MKLETRLRLEPDFDKKLIAKITTLNAIPKCTDYDAKQQELINYIRLQVSLAFKLGKKAAEKGESET